MDLGSYRIRIHGNLHLAQVLHSGKDFIFIDFEGETDRSYGERRIKRSPLRDVASMLRSFDHVVAAVLNDLFKFGKLPAENPAPFHQWGRYWRSWISAVFLTAYKEAVAGKRLAP